MLQYITTGLHVFKILKDHMAELLGNMLSSSKYTNQIYCSLTNKSSAKTSQFYTVCWVAL